MILTLTANPAIDQNVSADRLVFEDRAYILSTEQSAGGRGINASHVIQTFGGETMGIAVSGGAAGARFCQLLQCCKYPVEMVPVAQEIRTNLTITDKQGLTIKLNALGPRLEKDEVIRIEDAVRSKLDKASWLMLCGSLPPGVPDNFYARLIETARQANVKTLLDADGEALREGIEAGPTAVTPNQQEAERLLGLVLLTRTQSIDAARKIHAMGAGSVILSLGSRGAIGVMEKSVHEAVPPRVDAVCPIGAGDAMAAAFTWSMDEKGNFPDALRWGVAAGTASARLPGVHFANLEQTREIYQKVEVRQVR